MANYPGSASTDANLFIAVDYPVNQSTLNGNINSSVTTISLASTSYFPSAGGYVTIDSELISYTGVVSNTLTGCTRGVGGTTAASHTSGVPVVATVVAEHHNVLKNEIEAIETDLVAAYGNVATATTMATALSIIETQISGKLTSTLASADIFVGNGSNVATAVALSGDATLSNAGALTLATINSNVGSFTLASITVNAKGLITAASSGGSGFVSSITGTAHQVIASASTGAVTLSTPQNIDTNSTPTFANLTLSNTTNQLVLGTTNTVTLSSTAPSVSRTYTIPDAGAAANVVLDAGNYTIGGTWTFNNSITLASSKALILTDNTTHTVTVKATNSTTSYTLSLPTTAGTNGYVLQTDGSGNTSWVTQTSGSGTVTSVAMTVPSFLSVSGSPITTSGTLAVTLSGTALPVANGGTSSTSLTAHNVLIGEGTSAIGVAAPGTSGIALVSTGASSDPAFGQVNLASSSAVTGILANANTTAVSAATASTIMLRDSNINTQINNIVENFATTATAAATTTLTVSSNPLQRFTGTTTQTVKLPDCTTLLTGFQFYVMNRSTGTVTVVDNGSNTIQAMVGGTQATFTCASTGSANGTWDVSYSAGFTAGTGLTLTGTVFSLTNPVTVALGGTGLATLTAHNVMLGEGTSNVAFAAPGTTGYPLLSQGASSDPSFAQLSLTAGVTGTLPTGNGGTGTASSGTQYGVVYYSTTTAMASTAAGTANYPLVSNNTSAPTFQQLSLTAGVTGTLPVGNGGTGVANPTAHYVLVGAGSSAVSMISPSTSGYVLTSNGASSDPTFQAISTSLSLTDSFGSSFAAPTVTATGGSNTYSYKIQAVNSDGTTIAVSPQGTTTTASASPTITISWSALTGTSVYYVWRTAGGSLGTGICAITSGTSVTDDGGPNSSSYGFLSTGSPSTNLISQFLQDEAGQFEINNGTLNQYGQLGLSTVKHYQLATPAAPTVTTNTSGSNTRTYYVVAIAADGNHSLTSAAGTVSSASNLGGGSTFYDTVSWTSVTGAAFYDIYGGSGGGGQNGRIARIPATGTLSFKVYSAGGADPTVSAAGPTTNTTGMIQWVPTTGSTIDTALTRNAAGLLEIDNGTPKIWGSLIANNLTSVQLAAVAAPTITQHGSAGSGHITYLVIAVAADGTTVGSSNTTATTTSNATLSSSNYNIVTFTTVPGASGYNIYRTAASAMTSPTNANCLGKINATPVSGSPYNDQGGNGDGSTAPSVNTTGQDVFYDAEATPKTAALQAPATITTSYVLTLPTALPGTSGTVLASDTSGNLSFNVSPTFSAPVLGTPASGTLTNCTIPGSQITGNVPIGSGGTGQTSASAAYNALSPMTTTGDIEYESGTNTASRLAIGSSGKVLTVASGIPAWSSIDLAGSTTSLSGALTVSNGGTGLTTATTAYGVVCAGTTATGAFQVLNSLGSSTNVLTSNGASALPTWQAAPGGPVATVKLTAQSATIADTTLYTTPNDSTDHLYRISYAVQITTAGTSNSITPGLIYTDPAGNAYTDGSGWGTGTLSSLPGWVINATGSSASNSSGAVTGFITSTNSACGGQIVLLVKANTAIKYFVSVNGTAGSLKYETSWAVEKLI
jgi:hypothetical protein